MNSNNSTPTLRVLDANANRAAEGMRTLEETARFLLSAAELQFQFKNLRHDLSLAIARLPRLELLASRNTPDDIGTKTSTPSEQSRPDTASLIASASSRVQQALRCLEEYGKSIDVEFASQVEQIRYRVYDVTARLECLSLTTDTRRQRLASARLYALIDAGDGVDEMQTRMKLLADSGVGVIQLRDRQLDDRTLYERACVGASVARELGVLWIINDRPDIAFAADADGVHVGQEELPVTAVRRIVGAERLIGLSTHDMDQVQTAMGSCADYLGCGPTFPSTTKQFSSFAGCDFLQSVSDYFAQPEVVPRPAFAIGGITTDNVQQVADAGFDRIAVTSGLAGDDVTKAARVFLETLKTNDAPVAGR
ncbi:thiamine phosphate synthase [Neorhodopirellula lusitana]|uniref:thiamine phosphate synthase n=1 Tax=Neorhodopirellula lusitana TaxID=445327 RepID=UPI00384B7059